MTKTEEPKKVFLVRGFTGEWEDKKAWTVAAYLDESLANRHMASAQTWADRVDRKCTEMVNNKRSRVWAYELRDRVRGKSPFDPQFEMDGNGTSYHVSAVPLLTEVPEVGASHKTT